MYSGFIFHFEQMRSTSIFSSITQGEEFYDSFSADDWPLDEREIFIVCAAHSPNSLGAFALVERAHGSGGQNKPKYKFSDFIVISPPINLNDIAHNYLREEFLLSSPVSGHRLSALVWNTLIENIKKARPKLSYLIDALLAKKDQRASLIGGGVRFERLSEQRDALGVAMDIAGIDRGVAMSPIENADAMKARCITDLLPYYEREAVSIDREILDNLLKEEAYLYGHIEGAHGGSVTVYVSDSTPIESSLGTDLLIYQPYWNSFLLIQYKMMSDGSNGFQYTVDRAFREQFEKMSRVLINLPMDEYPDHLDFRINGNPFYFKFCERKREHNKEKSLARGMFIHHDVIHIALKIAGKANPKIGYKKGYRYFNNTEFCDLAKRGWLGTTTAGSAYIYDLISACQKGRTKMLAVVTKEYGYDNFVPVS